MLERRRRQLCFLFLVAFCLILLLWFPSKYSMTHFRKSSKDATYRGRGCPFSPRLRLSIPVLGSVTGSGMLKLALRGCGLMFWKDDVRESLETLKWIDSVLSIRLGLSEELCRLVIGAHSGIGQGNNRTRLLLFWHVTYSTRQLGSASGSWRRPFFFCFP